MLKRSPAATAAVPQDQLRSRTGPRQSRLERALRIEWLGQTVASLCWIASVFAYGISSGGDWLQLGAASAWLVSNAAAITTTEHPSTRHSNENS